MIAYLTSTWHVLTSLIPWPVALVLSIVGWTLPGVAAVRARRGA